MPNQHTRGRRRRDKLVQTGSLDETMSAALAASLEIPSPFRPGYESRRGALSAFPASLSNVSSDGVSTAASSPATRSWLAGSEDRDRRWPAAATDAAAGWFDAESWEPDPWAAAAGSPARSEGVDDDDLCAALDRVRVSVDASDDLSYLSASAPAFAPSTPSRAEDGASRRGADGGFSERGSDGAPFDFGSESGFPPSEPRSRTATWDSTDEDRGYFPPDVATAETPPPPPPQPTTTTTEDPVPFPRPSPERRGDGRLAGTVVHLSRRLCGSFTRTDGTTQFNGWYGFVRPDERSLKSEGFTKGDLFLHPSDAAPDFSPSVGDRVTFRLGVHNKRLKAVDVWPDAGRTAAAAPPAAESAAVRT